MPCFALMSKHIRIKMAAVSGFRTNPPGQLIILFFMKTITLFFSVLVFCACVAQARIVTLYYTEDGQNIEAINGYPINDDLSLSPDGDESWLVLVGQKFGPNGYLPKDSKLQLGALGKTRSLFMLLQEPFLGIGQATRYEQPIDWEDIAYVVPDTQASMPFHVLLSNGTTGEFFVNSEYTESPGAKLIQGKINNDLYIIKLKYNIPKSERRAGDRPDQIGIKAKAFSFSEQALKKAVRRGTFQD